LFPLHSPKYHNLFISFQILHIPSLFFSFIPLAIIFTLITHIPFLLFFTLHPFPLHIFPSHSLSNTIHLFLLIFLLFHLPYFPFFFFRHNQSFLPYFSLPLFIPLFPFINLPPLQLPLLHFPQTYTPPPLHLPSP
ncbi:KinB-signaling pathway activation protein, partial [Bacillus sp. WP8]|uniref:KinB-signaling pathway activation protein n=1 Tax=Bacillus sp. WP8 TaxID=756828 RepID=UPI0016435184